MARVSALAVVLMGLNYFWLIAPWLSKEYAWSLVHALALQTWRPAGVPASTPVVYHARVSLRCGCGMGVALLAGPALIAGSVRSRESRLVAGTVATHMALLGFSTATLARFFLPAVPGIVVLVAALVVEQTERRFRGRLRLAALVLATGILVAEPLANSTAMVSRLARADTRTLAAEWIDSHLPADARIVTWGAPGVADFGTPPLAGRVKLPGLPREQWRAAGAQFLIANDYPIPYSGVAVSPTWNLPPPLAVFDPFVGDANDAVFEPLDAFYLPLAGFSGIVRPGPRIRIWALSAPGSLGP